VDVQKSRRIKKEEKEALMTLIRWSDEATKFLALPGWRCLVDRDYCVSEAVG